MNYGERFGHVPVFIAAIRTCHLKKFWCVTWEHRFLKIKFSKIICPMQMPTTGSRTKGH